MTGDASLGGKHPLGDDQPALDPLPSMSPAPTLSVIGLGYVGAVSVACLAHLGLDVVGVDIDSGKVDAIANGRSPIVEPGLEAMMSAGAAAGRIRATTDLAAAVRGTDASLVMVGTPSMADGTCDLSFVEDVSRHIGRALRDKAGHHVVVLRCSVPPGTTLDVAVPLIEATSGKRLGEGFSVAFCPEFLREGAAIRDFFASARTVIGASDERAAALVRRILNGTDTRFVATSIPAAETVKYVDNVWHATKVVFANEVGRVCRRLGLDSHTVMDIFVQDNKLNISPAYMKPGFAFGGSCLPKDVRAFARLAADRGVDIPLIASLLASNRAQVADALQLLEPYRGRKFALLGVAFKAGTDDVRESPLLEIAGRLLADGESVRVHDECWPPRSANGHARPIGSESKGDLAATVAAVASRALDDVLAGADVLIVGHATEAYRRAVGARPPGTVVVDLVRLFKDRQTTADYRGLSW